MKGRDASSSADPDSPANGARPCFCPGIIQMSALSITLAVETTNRVDLVPKRPDMGFITQTHASLQILPCFDLASGDIDTLFSHRKGTACDR